MGKYVLNGYRMGYEELYREEQVTQLNNIANELAEKNRLRRLEMRLNDVYETTSEELEDKA